MQTFKTLSKSRLAVLIGGVALAIGMAWPLIGAAQDESDNSGDPVSHVQHNDNQSSGDPDLASQIAELHAKFAKLEAALKQNSHGMPSDTLAQDGQVDKPDKTEGVPPGERISAKFQNCLQCHQKRPSGQLPPSHLEMGGGNDSGAVEAGAADGQRSPGRGAGMKMKGQSMGGGRGMEKMGMGMSDKGMDMGKGMMGQGMGSGMSKKGQSEQAIGDLADEMKAMAAKGGGDASTDGSTSEAMDQQMKQLQQQMMQMQQQMQQLMQMQTLQMKVMEMQMNMMEMK